VLDLAPPALKEGIALRRFVIIGLVALVASLGLSGVAVGAGVTKVAPTQAEPGHPFTLIDTGLARLVDGSEAIFRLGGIQVVIPLDTHNPYNTAQGRLPRDMGGGT
jgi:hypothetical protein